MKAQFSIGPRGMTNTSKVLDFVEAITLMFEWGYDDLRLASDEYGVHVTGHAKEECDICLEMKQKVIVCGRGHGTETTHALFEGVRCKLCHAAYTP